MNKGLNDTDPFQGVVAKVTEEYIVLIKEDGTFKNIKRDKGQFHLIGTKPPNKPTGSKSVLPWMIYGAFAWFIFFVTLCFWIF